MMENLQYDVSQVLSFEPTPSKATKIKAALVEAGVEDSVDFYSYAISDKSGTAPFVVNVGVHMENSKWVVNDGESKDIDSIGTLSQKCFDFCVCVCVCVCVCECV